MVKEEAQAPGASGGQRLDELRSGNDASSPIEKLLEQILDSANRLLDCVREAGADTERTRNDRVLRSFSLGEVAEILGVSGSYLRQLSLDGLGPTPELGTARRRSYTLRQVNELRDYLASARPREALKFRPHRRKGEELQIITVAPGPTSATTSLYLAQGLALKGFRVLAIDLDDDGALSEMYGWLTSASYYPDSSMEAALRLDKPQSISSIIEKTCFDGLDFVPGTPGLDFFEFECMQRYLSGDDVEGTDASLRMVRALKDVEEDYDVVIIRCGGKSFLNAGAIEAATGILITARVGWWADVEKATYYMRYVARFLSEIEKTGRQVNLKFHRYLLTEYNPRDVSEQKAFARMREKLGDHLLTATVWESDAIRQAEKMKQSLYELTAGAVGRSAYEQAMETLSTANAEIMDIIYEVWGRPPMFVSQASPLASAGKAKS
ncbi:AAA family ATPase [Rhizobium leguminosarum]|uniref:AAA family ATPase n=1 Tax=Rhizobium leguminosarum TaxID=384 RepID=UPI001FEE6597|nr:AAA family ATPase [Rhizobium leguminosarum]